MGLTKKQIEILVKINKEFPDNEKINCLGYKIKQRIGKAIKSE